MLTSKIYKLPIISLVTKILCPCLIELCMIEGKIDWEKFIWAVFGQLVSTFVIITLFSNMLCPKVLLLTVRIMDDVKDYELDLEVHPDRLD